MQSHGNEMKLGTKAPSEFATKEGGKRKTLLQCLCHGAYYIPKKRHWIFF